MTERLTAARGRRALRVCPLVLLVLFLLQVILVPAHGVPGHDAMMSTSHGAVAEHSGAGHSADGHREHAQPGHGDDGGPLCHVAPMFTDLVANRFVGGDLGKLFLAFLALAAAVLTAVISLLPRPPSHRRWSSRPHWRPSGADLLNRVCVARI